MVKHTQKSYDVYTMKFLEAYLIIYNVISLCFIFASQGILLCFTAVEIAPAS